MVSHSKVKRNVMIQLVFQIIPMPGQCNVEQSHQLLDRFVEVGGNFIDTANIYSEGTSETIIGNWFQKR